MRSKIAIFSRVILHKWWMEHYSFVVTAEKFLKTCKLTVTRGSDPLKLWGPCGCQRDLKYPIKRSSAHGSAMPTFYRYCVWFCGPAKSKIMTACLRDIMICARSGDLAGFLTFRKARKTSGTMEVIQGATLAYDLGTLYGFRPCERRLTPICFWLHVVQGPKKWRRSRSLAVSVLSGKRL